MIDRREFLKMMTLCGVYGAVNRMSGNLLAAPPPMPGRQPAKSVIEIWVWGGPSHLETFDPKPNAGKAYNGDHGDIPTNVKGIRISEFLPKLAQHADKYSIIRSMCHKTNGHETATYLMQTGRMPGDGITYPAIGAVLAMLKSGRKPDELTADDAVRFAKFANAAAALCVSKRGAIPAMPTAAEVDKFIKEC